MNLPIVDAVHLGNKFNAGVKIKAIEDSKLNDNLVNQKDWSLWGQEFNLFLLLSHLNSLKQCNTTKNYKGFWLCMGNNYQYADSANMFTPLLPPNSDHVMVWEVTITVQFQPIFKLHNCNLWNESSHSLNWVAIWKDVFHLF